MRKSMLALLFNWKIKVLVDITGDLNGFSEQAAVVDVIYTLTCGGICKGDHSIGAGHDFLQVVLNGAAPIEMSG